MENDDRASLYSVKDLMTVHKLCGIPIVFDFHHHKFCTGDMSQEEAFKLALTTWPKGVRPMVHWSESPEDSKKPRHAHSGEVEGALRPLLGCCVLGAWKTYDVLDLLCLLYLMS